MTTNITKRLNIKIKSTINQLIKKVYLIKQVTSIKYYIRKYIK